jgi:large subunit ribosomal protein L21e
MPHAFGYRARTRHMFSRGFKNHGMIKLSTYMTPYKVRPPTREPKASLH